MKVLFGIVMVAALTGAVVYINEKVTKSKNQKEPEKDIETPYESIRGGSAVEYDASTVINFSDLVGTDTRFNDEDDCVENLVIPAEEPEIIDKAFINEGSSTMIPVDKLNLTNNIKSKLKEAGFDQLPANVTTTDLLEIRGIGEKYADQIIHEILNFMNDLI